jgi:hypothetical protein
MAITATANAASVLPGKMARDRRPARAGAFVNGGSVLLPGILQILRSVNPTEDTRCFAAMSGQRHDESRASCVVGFDGTLSRASFWEHTRARMRCDLVPIATDPGGNMICLDVPGDARGKVFFWDLRRRRARSLSPTPTMAAGGSLPTAGSSRSSRTRRREEASSTFADVAHFSDPPCEHAPPRSHHEVRLAPGSIHEWVILPADYSSVDPRAPL